MFYTALWCSKDEHTFRESIPLEFLSESIRRYNSTIKFSLVILEGYELFSPNYKREIETLGFGVINYSQQFTKIIHRFENIDKNYSQFERNCLLRWIAFKEIFLSENQSQFWHLDADMVLYASLDEIAYDTKGKTFFLQGTPALASISNPAWFDTYEKELKKLDENIVDYSNRATNEKPKCRLRDRELGNYSVFRNPIGSDQDFIEYLVGSQKLPQDNINTVCVNSDFYYVQNILEFLDWDEFQGNFKQYPVEMTENNSIIIGKRRIPLIHYTDSFILYANIFLFLYRLKLHRNPIFRPLLAFRIEEEKLQLKPISLFLYRVARRMKLALTRKDVIRALMKPINNSSKIQLIEIINYINMYYPTQKVGIHSKNV